VTQPTIGVVVRTLNEAELIGTCLETLAAQRGGFDLDVLVVDSGSSDDTIAIARAHGARILEIDSTDFDYSKSLNIGFENVRGDVLVSLSAHAIPTDEHWLEVMVAALADERVAGVSARQVPWPGAPWQEVHRLGHQFPEDRRAYAAGDEEIVFSNAASAIRRSVWREEPFALPASEDLEWAQRVVRAGWAVVYEPAATVLHSHHESARAQALRMIDVLRAAETGPRSPLRLRLGTVRQAAGIFVHDGRKILSLDEPFGRKIAYLAELAAMVTWLVVDFSRAGTTAERRRKADARPIRSTR
jgi:glycosyltransferase involved in cell wall biosynthesis